VSTLSLSIAEPIACAAVPRAQTSRILPMAALALILACAAMLRFTGLDREGRWGDEYFQTMQYGKSPWYVVLGARSNNQPPLDYLIGAAVYRVSGSTWALRAPAAFFGVAGVGALFLLARRLCGVGTGLLASALLAFAPLHYKLSQEARPYTIFVFGMLVTLWLLLRALEQPTRRRIVAYGVSAALLMLTRGLDPQVFALSCGLVLSVAWWLAAGAQRRAVARAWLATVAAGLFGGGVLWFLLRGDAGWTVFTSNAAPRAAGVERILATVVNNARIWWDAPSALFGQGALPVMLLGLLGMAWCGLRWRTWTLSVRCVLATMALCGPVYLLAYSAAVAGNPICDRYAMFLTPIIAVFAAAIVVELLRHSYSPAGNLRTRAASVFIGAAVVLLPATSTLALTRQYFRPDWRASAAYLGKRYSTDDVIMVIADRPLGAGQSPYWGKLDWPADAAPLGESILTLATSEAHWRRLAALRGRCCVVLKHAVFGQDVDAFTRAGVQIAPANAALTKFRGLDVLENFAAPDLAGRLIAACDTLESVPMQHGEVRAITRLLRSRVELSLGELELARQAYADALEIVPPDRRAWFSDLTAAHRAALRLPEIVAFK